jgi:hypothetical protein
MTLDDASRILYGTDAAGANLNQAEYRSARDIAMSLMWCINENVSCDYLAAQLTPNPAFVALVAAALGIDDAADCIGGSAAGCAWTLLGIIPAAKLAKVLKLFRWGDKAADIAKRAAGFCDNSFDPDTHVLMADGTTKPIKDVKVGDLVVATDPETGRTALKRVTALIASTGLKNLVDIVIRASRNGHETTGKLTATDNHPFWVTNRKLWVSARDLNPGDVLQDTAARPSTVVAIHKRNGEQAVHNFTVADIHTYYVIAGNTPVLAHNDGGEWTIDPNKSTKIMRGGPFGAKYYQQAPNSKGEVLWWSPDLKGDGGSKWKVYKETSKGLEWIADADVYGNYMPNKYKGEKGKFISWGNLRGC